MVDLEGKIHPLRSTIARQPPCRKLNEATHFVTLRDGHGATQIVVHSVAHHWIDMLIASHVLQDAFPELPLESTVRVAGTVARRPASAVNKVPPHSLLHHHTHQGMATGEVEVAVQRGGLEVLNACAPLPFPPAAANACAHRPVPR